MLAIARYSFIDMNLVLHVCGLAIAEFMYGTAREQVNVLE